MSWWNPFKWGSGSDNLLSAANNASKQPSLSQPSSINPELDTTQMKQYNEEPPATPPVSLEENFANNVLGDSWVDKVESQPSDYETMMSDFGEHWGQTTQGMEDFMDKIAYHESKGENVYQHSGGPGAGLFQYERGKGQGGMTARNRLAQWYQSNKMDVPSWLMQENMDELGFDASKLNEEQQRMLFLADKRYDKTASLRPEAIEDASTWWADQHWRGSEKDRAKRIASFNRDEDSWYDNQFVNLATTEQGSDAFTKV